MDKLIEQTLAGTLGHFWPDFANTGTEEEPASGYARIDDDGCLAIHTLTSTDSVMARLTANNTTVPNTIAAATEQSASLFFDVRELQESNIVGATRASTRSYRVRSAIVGFRLNELESANIRGLTAYFPGLTTWSQLQGSTVAHETSDDNKPTSWTTTLKAAPDQVADLNEDKELVLSTHWVVTGPEDRRLLYTPVTFESRSRRALPWHEHAIPLLGVQDLLGIAYGGFVAADGGVAELDLVSSAQPSSTAQWWSQRLMQAPKGAEVPHSMNEYPSFFLLHIGGLPGVCKWLTLRDEHPRATGPIVHRHRYGASASESNLNDISIAIEYWVNVHKPSHDWAKPLFQPRGARKDSQAARLARHVGEPFST